MLVLTRNIGQSLNIGDDVTVSVIKADAHTVSFGITAPADVSVHREEVYMRIQQKKPS